MKPIAGITGRPRLLRAAVLAGVLIMTGMLAISCGGDGQAEGGSSGREVPAGASHAEHRGGSGGHDMAGGPDATPETSRPKSETATVWVCECCPDVRMSEPGKCPECNMDLVPVEPVEDESRDDDGTVEVWTCGMHPSIRSEEPGKCPICNMDLVPVAPGDEEALKLDNHTLQMVEAGEQEVRYADLVRVIWAVGRVDYDERRVKHVASRIPGRVEHLHVDFAGMRVERGQPLLDIYSPELVTALADYKNALQEAGRTSHATSGVGGSTLARLAESAKVRLNLWGLSDQEISDMISDGDGASYRVSIGSPISGTVIEKHTLEGEYVREGQNLFMVADLSKVWVTADLYEDDLGYVEVGDAVEIQARTYPGEILKGRVSFIDPYLDEKTRSAKVRMELGNPDGRMKPGMYVEARLEVPVIRREEGFWTCPMHPEIIEQAPGECPLCGMFLEEIGAHEVLAIPKSAVVHTGDVAVVYVAKGEGSYEPRQVALGPVALLRGEGEALFYPVTDGLMAGERLLTDAGFLVHSQARLTGRASSAYGGALDAGAGHQHGH